MVRHRLQIAPPQLLRGNVGASFLQDLTTVTWKQRVVAHSKLFGTGCIGAGTAAALSINIAGLLFKGMGHPNYAIQESEGHVFSIPKNETKISQKVVRQFLELGPHNTT